MYFYMFRNIDSIYLAVKGNCFPEEQISADNKFSIDANEVKL